MAIKKYIDQNGYLLYCNPIDNTDSTIKCFDKEDGPEIACNGVVSFPEGCGYPFGYNTRYSYVRFFKVEYDVPEEITCTFPRLIGSFFSYEYTSNGNYCGNNWWWWYNTGIRPCGLNSIKPYLPQLRQPSVGGWWGINTYTVYPGNLGRCSESPANANVYSRLANCKTPRCVPLNPNNMSHKCAAINEERELNRCCVSASDCGPNNNCKAEASRIEKTYTVSYEIVKSGFYCLEELPEAPEEPTCRDPYFGQSQDFLERKSCEYSGGDDCDAQGDVNYSCVNREDLCSDGGGSGSFLSLSSKEVCSITYTYKKKDCDCQCSSCVDCSSFESDSCMYGLGDGYNYYYGYNFSHIYLIGSDCCSTFGNYGSWYWWWRGYGICPSSDPPNSKFVFDVDTNTCSMQPNDSIVEPPDINYGTNKIGCFLRQDPFDRKCIPPYPNWQLINACDTETIDDYNNRECWERGPPVTKTISYANQTVANQNTDRCLPDDTSNQEEPPKTVEYVSFKPKYCEQEIVKITNYNLVYSGNMPTNLRDWIACQSSIIGRSSDCFDCEPAEEICYEDKRSLVLYALVYKPEEVLDTVDAQVTITYCQMSVTKCQT